MTRYEIDGREVQPYMALSEPRGYFVGAYAELRGDGAPQMVFTTSTRWTRIPRTAEDLMELDDTVVVPCGPEDIDEVLRGAWWSLVDQICARAAQVPLARLIAEGAHADQVDKIGEPYIGHPQRVAESLTDPIEQVTAWLHDVLEDTSGTADDLLRDGVDPAVVAAVQALTRRPADEGDVSDHYYGRIAVDPIALTVKRADIADNLQPWRTGRLDEQTRRRLEEKYAVASLALDLAQLEVDAR